MKYSFSQRSRDNLLGVHHELIILCTYALATSKVDFVITDGLRLDREQLELFKIGRRFVNGRWEKIPGQKQVTWTLDSKHEKGLAVDLYPYPVPKNLSNPGQEYIAKQLYLRKHLKACAKRLGISLRIIRKDLPHFEI